MNKVTFSFSRKTPMWVKWVYRVSFAITTAAAFVIASEPTIDAELKVRLCLYLKGLDMVLYTIGQGLGVKEIKPDTDNPN